MRRRALGAVATAVATALCLCASRADAQIGAAIGIRSVLGDETVASSSERRGLDLRVHFDRDVTPVLGWRAEITGVQMQFRRDEDTRRFLVTENGIEASASIRASARDGSLSGTYVLAGPTMSWRGLCGADGYASSNGRVPCDPGESRSVGYHLGLGYANQISAKRFVVFELRLMDRVVAGHGNPLAALSIGVR